MRILLTIVTRRPPDISCESFSPFDSPSPRHLFVLFNQCPGRSALTTLFCSTSLIALVAAVALLVRLASSIFFALPLAEIFGLGELVPMSPDVLATMARLRIVVDTALPLLSETLPTICLLLIFGMKPPGLRKKGGRGGGGASNTVRSHEGVGQRDQSTSLLGDEERPSMWST